MLRTVRRFVLLRQQAKLSTNHNTKKGDNVNEQTERNVPERNRRSYD